MEVLPVRRRAAAAVPQERLVVLGGLREGDGAALAGRHQLAVLEAERGDRAQFADPAAAPAGAVGVRGVLHDRDARVGGELAEGVQVGDLAGDVDRHDRAGPRGDRGRGGLGAQVVGVEVDVDRHRGGTEPLGGLGGGDERERGHDDLGARADAEQLEGDLQRVGAVGDGERLGGAVVVGELLLEGVDLLAAHPPPLALLQRPEQSFALGLVVLRPDRELRGLTSLGSHDSAQPFLRGTVERHANPGNAARHLPYTPP